MPQHDSAQERRQVPENCEKIESSYPVGKKMIS